MSAEYMYLANLKVNLVRVGRLKNIDIILPINHLEINMLALVYSVCSIRIKSHIKFSIAKLKKY